MTHGSGTLRHTGARPPDSHGPPRPVIRRLPPLLVNQIAAGEVIERPASVVKELVENALDAGSTRIIVELEAGGVELIRVRDDGAGIEPDQLPLALAPHATSKIETSEDLDRIATLGFRGEALASIASVSRMTITSRVASSPEGCAIEGEGEHVAPPMPRAAPVGTCVEVRNLFFNTPARRKFLRTPSTEQSRCRDWLVDLAMARPFVAFQFIADGRTLLDLPSTDGPRDRALDLLGRELESELLEVRLDALDDARGVTLWGLAGLPSIARATNRSQHVYINGRAIRDRTIQHALKEAYRGLIEPGRHPTAVLMLEMNPASIDANVHPAKLEVRFRDQSAVHQAVLRAVREALRGADLTPAFSSPRSPAADPRQILPSPGPSRALSPDELVEFLRHRPARSEVPSRPLSVDALRDAVARADNDPSSLDPHAQGDAPARFAPSPGHDSPTIAEPRPLSRALQVHNQYLVTQDDRGILLVDQHALHERVMFERLLARVRSGPLERQRLLTPAVLDASPERQEHLASLGPLLERVGVACASLGPRTIAIHEFPTLLFERGVDPVDFLESLLDAIEDERFIPGDEQALHEVLDMMACKAAIKAGDRLSDSEIADLLAQREAIERSSNCPHGRPTSIRVTISQLDRMFGRS